MTYIMMNALCLFETRYTIKHVTVHATNVILTVDRSYQNSFGRYVLSTNAANLHSSLLVRPSWL